MQLIKSWFKLLGETVFSFSCHICNEELSWGNVLCNSCFDKLTNEFCYPTQVTDVLVNLPIWTFGYYQGHLANVLKTIKYKPSLKLLKVLHKAIEPFTNHTDPDFSPEVLIPVPLHSARETLRGFNQSTEFAQFLAAKWNIPLSPLLRRVKKTRPQADCNEIERLTNLKGAFELANNIIPQAFANKTICLVDDVATTGATLFECTKVLNNLPCRKVIAVVIAHTPRYAHSC